MASLALIMEQGLLNPFLAQGNGTTLAHIMEHGLLLPFLDRSKDMMVLGVDKMTANILAQYLHVQHGFIMILKIT